MTLGLAVDVDVDDEDRDDGGVSAATDTLRLFPTTEEMSLLRSRSRAISSDTTR
jgi:hypothetical protein